MSGMLALPDGARIAYEDRGSAEGALPLVLLHAFPLHRAMWAPQIEALSITRRCIAPDFRGFGESTGGAERVTMDRLADDVAALLDHLAIDHAAIAGLSMGGYVAFALLRRHRARVRALVLADTRASADSDEARTKRADLIALARAEGSAAVTERQLPTLLGNTSREKRPEVVEQVQRIVSVVTVDALVAGAEALRDRPDSTEALRTIELPTLLLCGTEDTITKPEEMRAMAAAIPSAQYLAIDEAGHLSNLERPEAFTEALGRFLGE